MNTITLNGAVIEIPEGFRIAEMRPTEEPNDYHIRLTQDSPYQMYPDSYHQHMQLANLQNAYNCAVARSQYPGKTDAKILSELWNR